MMAASIAGNRKWEIVGSFEKAANAFLKSAGAASLVEVYAHVQKTLPELCVEASDECEHNGVRYGQPEWNHLVRWAMHNLRDAGLADCVDHLGTAWLTTVGRSGGPTPAEAEQRATELFARTRRSADHAETKAKKARMVLGLSCARCGHVYRAEKISSKFCPPPCGGWLRTVQVDPTAIDGGD